MNSNNREEIAQQDLLQHYNERPIVRSNSFSSLKDYNTQRDTDYKWYFKPTAPTETLEEIKLYPNLPPSYEESEQLHKNLYNQKTGSLPTCSKPSYGTLAKSLSLPSLVKCCIASISLLKEINLLDSESDNNLEKSDSHEDILPLELTYKLPKQGYIIPDESIKLFNTTTTEQISNPQIAYTTSRDNITKNDSCTTDNFILHEALCTTFLSTAAIISGIAAINITKDQDSQIALSIVCVMCSIAVVVTAWMMYYNTEVESILNEIKITSVFSNCANVPFITTN